MTTRSQQLADALIAIAKANHYMVGLVENVTDDELHSAEQILISAQNKMSGRSKAFKVHDLALDLIENMSRNKLAA